MTKTALVTGACSGIGLELARELAVRGYALVLVSNREEPLGAVARELRSTHGVDTHAVVMDLACADAARLLLERVGSLGAEVDVLVNNAGFFFFGEVADADPARAAAMVTLHVLTPSLLCTAFARRMRERGAGHILVVSSISAWKDFPGIAYYGATKRYLRSFAKSLRSELKPYGVNVTCLAPGATATGLYAQTGAPVEMGRRLGVMMDARVVARAGLRAMFTRRAVCVPGVLTRVMVVLAVLTPQVVIDLIRRRAPWLRPRLPSTSP
jgi:short-subunit dehydrogenase